MVVRRYIRTYVDGILFLFFKIIIQYTGNKIIILFVLTAINKEYYAILIENANIVSVGLFFIFNSTR